MEFSYGLVEGEIIVFVLVESFLGLVVLFVVELYVVYDCFGLFDFLFVDLVVCFG